MATLNSNGEIIIPHKDHNALYFLIINATCFLVTKTELTATEKRVADLASELLGLIANKRRSK
jgi:hypothetical protein